MKPPIPDFILERISPDGWIKPDAVLGIFSSVHESRYASAHLTDAQFEECWRQTLDIASDMVRRATAPEERVA